LENNKLGNGSYGDVFEVKNIESKNIYVVKKFKAIDIYNRRMTLEYFIDMIELLKQNKNEYIVDIIDRMYYISG